MSMYQRGSVWWIEVRMKDGKRLRESAGTSDKAQAQVFHDRRIAEIARGIEQSPTWEMATNRWMRERLDKRSLRRDLGIVKWLDRHWSGMKLQTIDDVEIRRVLEIKRSETTASNANHYLSYIKSLFNKSVEWGYLEKSTQVKPYRVKSHRIRFLSEDEIKRLMAELPHHLRVMAEFSLLTGLRQSNVTGLRWDQIDMKRKVVWIYGSEYKSGHDHGLPLNDRTIQILEGESGKHEKYVFTYKGARVANPRNTAWHNALARAGIKDFRWHDLRHTFASYHAMNGTPLLTLKALGGWQTLDMVNRYAHLSAEGARRYVDNSSPVPLS